MQGLGGLPLHLGDVDAFLGHLVKWGKLAQLGDDLNHLVDDVVDFLLRVKSTEAETDRGVGQIFADAQSLKDIARFQRGRSAGRTARYCNVVDAHEERFAFDIGDAQVQVVGRAMLERAVDEDFIELGFEALFKAVAKSTQPNRFFFHFLLAKLTSLTEAHDARHVERAGTHAALVAAAIDDSGELNAGIAAANVQRADALGAVNLVAADGQHVDVVLLDIHRNLAYRLHAIGGEENAVFLGDFADFGDGIDDADFVVGVHDGDKDGGRADGGFQLIQVDPSVLLHRQIGDFEAVFLKAFASVQDSLVLDGLGDDVVALFAEHLRDTFDHQVVGFR